jgi:hypothetical protein
MLAMQPQTTNSPARYSPLKNISKECNRYALQLVSTYIFYDAYDKHSLLYTVCEQEHPSLSSDNQPAVIF